MVSPGTQAIPPDRTADVTVLGGGLAGLAAALHLAKAGLSVNCIEPNKDLSRFVGESLDWSAPELFGDLDLSMEDLVNARLSTYKRRVVLNVGDQASTEYIPSDWLGRPPFKVELRTLHLDRPRLHRILLDLAQQRGVTLIQERVTSVERNGKKIKAVLTSKGNRYTSPWFIDASGSASRLFAREFRLPFVEYGPKKVAMWAYFPMSQQTEGTTLYAEAPPQEYLRWIWEIPINPETLSVGYVVSGASLQEQRQGLPTNAVYRQQLSKFSRLQALVPEDADDKAHTLATVSFQCRAYKKASGPNWLIVGEAAAMPDPITGNGVTAALRHAAEAAGLIVKYKKRSALPFVARLAYNWRVYQMGRFFNSLIEKLAYDWPVRDHLGLLTSGDIYTSVAWSANHLYSRFRPSGLFSTVLFSAVLTLLRSAAWTLYQFCCVWSSCRRMVSVGSPFWSVSPSLSS